MSNKLLIDQDQFWSALKNDIAAAKKSIYLQTLSFEGDTVGKKLCEALKESNASDIRIVVDCYTKYIISDRFIYTPSNFFDPELKTEVRETKNMIEDIRANGIRVKWVNPAGFLLHKLPARNHKKLIVIDDRIAYIGGVNFSEHNFAWHDLMLRIEADDIATFFADDFRTAWEGKNVTIARRFGGIEFLMFDGYNNEVLFDKIMNALDRARKQIWLESPYLSFPFVEKLKKARERGVEINIVTPANNNKKSIQNYILYEGARCGFKVYLYRERMTHLKAILIDNEQLVLGSTNFDFLSYTMQQEIAALIDNPEIISDFIERVVKVDCANSDLFDGQVDMKAGASMAKKLKSLGKLSVWLNRGHVPKLD